MSTNGVTTFVQGAPELQERKKFWKQKTAQEKRKKLAETEDSRETKNSWLDNCNKKKKTPMKKPN